MSWMTWPTPCGFGRGVRVPRAKTGTWFSLAGCAVITKSVVGMARRDERHNSPTQFSSTWQKFKQGQAQMETADEMYAAKVASMILGSFTNPIPNTPLMLEQLTTLLTGKPKTIVARMYDPRVGVAAKSEFFSLAACNKWLDANLPERVWKPLPPLIEEKVAPEVREQRVNMLKAVAREIRDCVKAKTVGRPLTPTQTHSPSKLLEALENLEAMNFQTEEQSQ